MDKETIVEIVLAAFASGFLSAILVKLLDIMQERRNQKIEEKMRKLKKEEEERDTYIEEKKSIYIEALKKLVALRTGFDMTYDFPYDNKQINKMIEDINNDAFDLSAKIRLYASDEVFDVYSQLASWRRYAFTRSGQWRISSVDKERYAIYLTLLARLMQKDLGFREYIEEPEMVTCPKCSKKHNAYKTCKCGMTWKETMIKIGETMRQSWEESQEDGKVDSSGLDENKDSTVEV